MTENNQERPFKPATPLFPLSPELIEPGTLNPNMLPTESEYPPDNHIQREFTFLLEPVKPDYLKRVSESSLVSGKISMLDLVLILGADKRYSIDILQKLWDRSGFSVSTVGFPSNLKSLKTDEQELGCKTWFWLLCRLTMTNENSIYLKENFLQDRNFPIFGLYEATHNNPLKSFARSPVNFIKLDEFKAFIERLNALLGLDVPLPSSLFPDSKSEAASDHPDSPSVALDREPSAAVPEDPSDLSDKPLSDVPVNRDQLIRLDAKKCYKVYKRLLTDEKNGKGELTRDAWAEEIRKLRLKHITPAHIHQMETLRYARSNLKARIINNLVKIAAT